MEQGQRILIVEDEPLSQDVIVRRLQSRGFQTATAGDGIAALEWLAKNSADLVLMDIAMPRMNGLDATRELRRTWSHDALPIIVVSASVDSDDVVAAIEAGANDFVVKPINFRVLMARIHASLRMKRTISLLVEAERQRVMIESINSSLDKIVLPMRQVVDRLESAMQRSDDTQRDQLEPVLEWIEQTVDVIDQLRRAGTNSNVPYQERLQRIIEDSPRDRA
jgi:adenylate cyclase